MIIIWYRSNVGVAPRWYFTLTGYGILFLHDRKMPCSLVQCIMGRSADGSRRWRSRQSVLMSIKVAARENDPLRRAMCCVKKWTMLIDQNCFSIMRYFSEIITDLSLSNDSKNDWIKNFSAQTKPSSEWTLAIAVISVNRPQSVTRIHMHTHTHARANIHTQIRSRS